MRSHLSNSLNKSVQVIIAIYVFEINDSWSEKNHISNRHLKGRAKRFSRKIFPLSGETLNILNVFRKKQSEFLKGTDQINKNDYILLNLRDSRLAFLGMPIGQASMNLIIKKVAKKVKVNNEDKQISCYNCRHTVASKWANTSGIALSFLAFRLGHSFQQLLKTYVHEDADRSQNMMDLMKKNNNKKIINLKCA
ncbi:tyrosine-type recombinase/integrase [Lactobacillus johnsonii]|uniref:tyrosine-type recombinase/integrase n=1 Tax=Lactobacillus johnsonii TaxID=33959 RepID=UPI002B25B177|nr:tyrosine-type recombinase/integrase [Lactobacillus johnsonii]